MSAFFIWKGINSLDKNITVTSLPDIIRPEERVEKIPIEGRSGYLTRRNNTFESVIKSCECTLDDYSINEVSQWLTGEDEVIFSNDLDKKYRAIIINQIPYSKVIPTLHNFIVVFDCQPFGESVTDDSFTLTTASDFYNIGTIESLPELKIFGSGDVTISINNNSFVVKDIQDYAIVDSEMENCYKWEGSNMKPLNNKMEGVVFPVFDVGDINISWTGNITKIEIKPRWRWL